VRGRYCVLEIQFKTERELQHFVSHLRDHGWLLPEVTAQRFGRLPGATPSGVQLYYLRPRPDSRAGAVAVVRLKGRRGRRTRR
jgi:hypothetical protein